MNIGDMLGVAMRLIANRDEIERLLPKVQDSFQTLAEVKALLDKIFAPAAPGAPLDVSWLQTSLNSLLGANIQVDGDYGEQTKAAVRQYQRNSGLRPDGWAGMLTEASIFNALSRRH